MSHSPKIAGEDILTLARFFLYVELTRERNGRYRVSANHVPPDIAAPLLRAIMRREARLLTEDAEAMEDFTDELRSPAERRADAFVDVMMSVAAALKYTGLGSGPST